MYTYTQIRTCRFLLEQDDIDINVIDSDGNTPLHTALELGQETISMLLILHGANVSAVNNVGRTPLHFAALQGMEQVCVCMFMYTCVYR